MIWLIPIILAFAYRSRGMAHASFGDTVNRLVSWALPVGLVCTLIAHLWGFPLWMGLLCAGGAFAGVCIGHSSDQGDSMEQYERMGLYCTLLLVLILLPFLLDISWDFYVNGVPLHHRVAFMAVVPIGYLGFVASWLGYRMHMQLRTFGIQWCRWGDSSWEEFYIGALAFGVPLAVLGILA